MKGMNIQYEIRHYSFINAVHRIIYVVNICNNSLMATL